MDLSASDIKIINMYLMYTRSVLLMAILASLFNAGMASPIVDGDIQAPEYTKRDCYTDPDTGANICKRIFVGISYLKIAIGR